MPKLRGHHLICFHFFHGEGYDAGFVDNLRSVIAKTQGEQIQICAGPDDVCRKCPHLKGDACTYDEAADDAIAEMDGSALRLLGMRAGENADWDGIREALAPLFRRWHEAYCTICTWRQACEKDDFFRSLSRNVKNRHGRKKTKTR